MPSLAGSNGSNGGSYSITIAPSYNGAFGFVTVKDRLIVECPATFSSATLTTVDLVCNRAAFTSLTAESLTAGTALSATAATIDTLSATAATIDTLSATTATIGAATVTGTLTTTGGVSTDTVRPRASTSTDLAVTTTGAVNLSGQRINFAGGTNGAVISNGTQVSLVGFGQTILTATGAGGRVGIMTSSPTSTLHVAGDVTASNATVSNTLTSATLVATNGIFSSVSVTNLYTGNVSATSANFTGVLTSTNGQFTTLTSTNGQVTTLTSANSNVTGTLTSANGRFTTLTSTSVAVTGTLTSADGQFSSGLTLKSQTVPVCISGTNVISSSSGTNLSIDLPLSMFITPSTGYACMLVMNGDMAANGGFRPLSGHLMNSVGVTTTPYTQYRLIYNSTLAAPSRVYYQVIYQP